MKAWNATARLVSTNRRNIGEGKKEEEDEGMLSAHALRALSVMRVEMNCKTVKL